MAKAGESLSDNDLESFTSRKDAKKADSKNSEHAQQMLLQTVIPLLKI
ncbi:hypothetical protein NZD88_15820 [Chryseobacterium antibioticum]|uniref:Uncharacterized protein n=1 Tax=Chryseobacterium pyrolae TaxID=2987481 RepID=A0ABT2IK33_9FLAO|nr:hypothetical protein [Chryseobacterium pyrolae]MCT2409015.1 hypothetical protein [Chryseobacterium pyrolae]